MFGMVLFLCGALFLLSTAYYLYRLHQINVESGAEPAPDAAPKEGAKKKKEGRDKLKDKELDREMGQVSY